MRKSTLFTIALLMLFSSVLFGQIPKTLSYQGLLSNSDGTSLNDGDYSIKFSLYTQESGGTALWEESHTVSVSNSIFSTVLGSSISLDLPFDAPYWLGIMVEDDAEMSPRTALTSSAYSLSGSGDSMNWNKTDNNLSYSEGNVGIGTTMPTEKLVVNNGSIKISNTGDFNALIYRPFVYLNQNGESNFGGGILWQDNGENKLELFHQKETNELIFHNSEMWHIAALRDSGSLWLNSFIEPTAVKFRDGSVLTSANTGIGGKWSSNEDNIFYNSGNVGIGTESPYTKFVVQSNSDFVASFHSTKPQSWVGFLNNTSNYVGYIGTWNSPENNSFDVGTGTGNASGDFNLVTQATPRVTIKPETGNVGIGMQTPYEKLVVNGNTVTKNLSLEHDGRGAIFFAGTGDLNHVLYNNYSDIDGEGSFDGIKWNIFDGINMKVGSGDSKTSAFYINSDGNVGIGITSPVHPLEMASGAHVTAGGVWTNASSRSLKENISALTTKEAFDALSVLNPVKYNYLSEKNENYVGFIAEDVPDVVAMNDRKSLSSMDIVALLTKVVKEQQKSIELLSNELELLKKKVELE